MLTGKLDVVPPFDQSWPFGQLGGGGGGVVGGEPETPIVMAWAWSNLTAMVG